MIYIEMALVSIALILLMPTLVIFVQVLSACFLKVGESEISQQDISLAVLIPAHNESSGIIATLNSIKSQLKTTDRLLVVADNCSDNTATVALGVGAEVIERNDLIHRGKGYALDFGIRHLEKSPPEVVIIIDADCIVELNGLNSIASFALHHDSPVQAQYLMYAKSENLKSKIAEFAWCVKNLVRPLGFAKLGLPCLLMGTGMAFPWNKISKANLANSNIVEDMKLGIDLSLAGSPPIFYAKAKVTSDFPLTDEVQNGQRTRWEHGHLAMILSEAPKLFIQGIIKGNKNLLAMAFELSVPPLALLVMLLLGFATTTGLMLLIYDIGQLAFQITLAGFVLLSIAILMAWLGWGRNIITFTSLLLIPVYVVSKIPGYIKFIFKRQKAWNKTERD